MAVFQCFRADGHWDNFETDATTLAEFHEQLQRGSVLGSVLLTTPTADRGVRVVTGRRAKIITPQVYTEIQDCRMRFVEYEDDDSGSGEAR
ncbi:hypothetical protein [Acuticoccus sediminis]|uniref:hypothetical protein n=1 Tax=Acuticoccus sediminis TaxID=2184697 RepID=UPI001CFEE89F|nr:hypothetical protein [Acuticoccus sediminis]